MRAYSNEVDRIEENGNIIKSYKNIREAMNDLEISRDSIYKILRGTNKKTKKATYFNTINCRRKFQVP